MEKKTSWKGFAPVVMIFVVTTAFFVIGRGFLENWGADQDILLIGNTLLFAVTLLSFLLAMKGLRNPNPYAFVRSVYASIMIKLFVCLAGAFLYISMTKSEVNKPALFTCMGLYLAYTFTEIAVLMKLLKGAKNG